MIFRSISDQEWKRKKGTRKKISCLDIDSKCSGPSLSQDTSYYLLSPAKVVRKQKTENYSSVPRHNEQKRRGRWRVARRGVRQGVQSNDLCLPWQLAPSERYLPFDFSPIFRNVTIIHRIDNLKIFTSAIFLFENVYKYIRFVVKTLLLFVTKNQAFSSNFFSSLNCTFDVKTTIDLARKKISLTWKFGFQYNRYMYGAIFLLERKIYLKE